MSAKSYIKACVLTCKRPLFWRYLMERACRLVTNEGEALKVVRMLCGFRSRRELIQGTEPAKNWETLISRFNEWNKNR